MNNLPKTVLLLAGVCFSPLVLALNFSTDGLLKQSHLNLTLKNIWMLNTIDSYEELVIGPQSASAQALHLNYRSG